jgi:hypothetical protein
MVFILVLFEHISNCANRFQGWITEKNGIDFLVLSVFLVAIKMLLSENRCYLVNSTYFHLTQQFNEVSLNYS